MDKEDRSLLLFLLLSHHKPDKLNRTIHISLRGRDVYICARCTGIYAGIIAIFVAYFLGFSLPLWWYLPLLCVFPAPCAVDWITQSCKLRESRNALRVCTGFLLGMCWGLFFLLLVKGVFHFFLYAVAILGAYVFLICILAWKTGFLETYFE